MRGDVRGDLQALPRVKSLTSTRMRSGYAVAQQLAAGPAARALDVRCGGAGLGGLPVPEAGTPTMASSERPDPALRLGTAYFVSTPPSCGWTAA